MKKELNPGEASQPDEGQQSSLTRLTLYRPSTTVLTLAALVCAIIVLVIMWYPT
jgi:hypothetical protein